jgi:hypothetical protein
MNLSCDEHRNLTVMILTEDDTATGCYVVTKVVDKARLLSLKHFDKHQLHSGESQEYFLINEADRLMSTLDYDEHTEERTTKLP